MLMSPVGNVSINRAQAVFHTCCMAEGQLGLFLWLQIISDGLSVSVPCAL
jgi:hypothetical protein